MESLTYLKNLKITPKKLRMLRDDIYQMSPQHALEHLQYTAGKPAQIYYKVIHSAVHNAIQTLKVPADVLKFKLLTIEEGHTLRRYNPGSRGNAKPFAKRFSHIKIILVEGEKQVAKSIPPEQKKEIKPAEKKTKPVQKAAPKKTVKTVKNVQV